MNSISNSAVEAVINGEQAKDPEARIAELEKQLAKVRKDIAEQERLEKHYRVFQTACEKLRRELGKTLTHEEREAIDGLYIFLHSGCVDFVRHVPSATDKGENKRLNQDLDTVEALHELSSLLK